MIIVNSIPTREGIVLARAWTWLLAQVLQGRALALFLQAGWLVVSAAPTTTHFASLIQSSPRPTPPFFLLLPLACFLIFPVSYLFAFVCVFDLQNLYMFENLLRQRRSLSPPPFFNLLTAPPLLCTSINTWARLLFFNNFFSPPSLCKPITQDIFLRG